MPNGKKHKPEIKKNIGAPRFCMGKRITPIPDTRIFLKVRRIHSAGGPHPLIPSPEKGEGAVMSAGCEKNTKYAISPDVLIAQQRRGYALSRVSFRVGEGIKG